MQIGTSSPANQAAAAEARELIALLPNRFKRLLEALKNADVYQVNGNIHYGKLARALKTSTKAARQLVEDARKTIEVSQPE